MREARDIFLSINWPVSYIVNYYDRFVHGIVSHSIVLLRSLLYCIVLLMPCIKFVGVLDNPLSASEISSGLNNKIH